MSDDPEWAKAAADGIFREPAETDAELRRRIREGYSPLPTLILDGPPCARVLVTSLESAEDYIRPDQATLVENGLLGHPGLWLVWVGRSFPVDQKPGYPVRTDPAVAALVALVREGIDQWEGSEPLDAVAFLLKLQAALRGMK